jgi:rRNA maturation endonuclease Nob1
MTFRNDDRNQGDLSPREIQDLADELERLILAGAINGDYALQEYLRSLGLEAVVEEMTTVIRTRRLTYRPLRSDF